MIIAKGVNNGDCPECGAKQSLELSIIREKAFTYGYVSCIKCNEWITNYPPDALQDMGF